MANSPSAGKFEDRIRQSETKWIEYAYPLWEWKITREKCIEIIKKAGLIVPMKLSKSKAEREKVVVGKEMTRPTGIPSAEPSKLHAAGSNSLPADKPKLEFYCDKPACFAHYIANKKIIKGIDTPIRSISEIVKEKDNLINNLHAAYQKKIVELEEKTGQTNLVLGIVKSERDAFKHINKTLNQSLQALKSQLADYTEGQIEPITKRQKAALIEQLEKEISDFPNPYPKDVFLWMNKEKLPFNRGRFNEFTHKMFENFREDIMEFIKDAGL